MSAGRPDPSHMALIDQLLPRFQFHEKHQLLTSAHPGALLAAVLQPGVTEDPWARRFIQLRELPDRLAGALGGRSALQQQPAFGLHNFTPLGRHGDREMAFGLVGKFWQADYGQVRVANAQAFAEFDQPGVPKLVINFSTEPADQGRTWLRTETRVFCNDGASLRRFTPYWWLIRPVSGLIRQRLLRRIQHAASPTAP
jgi:hypothetical protein